MNGVITLCISSLFEIAFTICLYALNRKNEYESKLGSTKWQLIVGLIYGIIAIIGTECGVPYDGFVLNIRDAAPLIAGLYFGPLSGVIAGLMGGIERYIAVLWGAGEFTRLACSLGTIFAGVFGAFIKKFILNYRTPSWVYALTMGFVAEVLHMLLVFSTNPDDVAKSLQVIYVVGPVTIPLVSITVAGTAIYNRLLNVKNNQVKPKKTIAADIQNLLLFSVIIAFMLANAYVVVSQTQLAKATAENSITQSLVDASNDAKSSGLKGDELKYYMAEQITNWHIGSTGYFIVFNESGTDRFCSSKSIVERDNLFEVDYYVKGLKAYDEMKTYYLSERDISEGYSYYFAYSKVEDCYILAVYPGEEAHLGKNFSIIITAFMEILIMAFLFIQIYFLIRKVVVDNIDRINESLSGISRGNLDIVIDVRSNQEFTSLSDDINMTVGTLKQYISDAEKRIDAELDFAREIQSSALPTSFPRNNDIDLYARMMPAKVVGGDFYDFYQFGDNKLAILVADVSGKGIPAALFMMNSKALIKSLVESGGSPSEVLRRANAELCSTNSAGMFVTAWLGIIDCNTGELRYCNAGHNYPIIARNDGSVAYLKKRHGLVLAAMEDAAYREDTITLSKGDGLFIYTDGVTEATDENNELYGEERLIDTVNSTDAVNMRYLCKKVKEDIDAFVGNAPQFDDITMLALKLKDESDASGCIELNPTQESSVELAEFIEQYCETNSISAKLTRKMLVVNDEIYSNIVRYSGASKAIITIQRRNELVSISFEDDGIAYNPLEKDDPDVTLTAEEREIGGLGIFMVKNMSEDIKYSRINANNILDIILK